MSEVGGVCPVHPQRAATFACARCGDFGCDECANRVVPEAQPICPSCWSRREQRVATMKRDDGSYIAIGSLVLGILALVPCLLWAQIGSIALGFVALSRIKDHPQRRTMATIGIVLGFIGIVFSFLAVVVFGALDNY